MFQLEIIFNPLTEIHKKKFKFPFLLNVNCRILQEQKVTGESTSPVLLILEINYIKCQ